MATGQVQNVKIDELSGDLGPCEPTIAISPLNPNRVVAGAILDRVYYSNDGGLTWHNDTLSSPYGVFGDPCIIADDSGYFYYFHLSNPSGEREHVSWLDRIVCQKTIDGGKTWNAGSFTGLNSWKDQDKEWAVYDPGHKNIYLTWTEFDQYESTNPGDSTYILFSKSIDRGETWSRPIRINQYAGNCLDDDFTVEGAVPAVGPGGEIYVAWAYGEKIYFDRSDNQGKTWLENDVVAAQQPGGWSFEVPGIYRTNGFPVTKCDISQSQYSGRIYINWSDQRNGEDNTDIWLIYSDDQGETWSKPQKINDDSGRKQQFFNWMDVDPVTGNIYIVYYDRRNYEDTQTDVYLAYSSDGGTIFNNVKISDTPFIPAPDEFFGDYNNISAFDGNVRPVWTRADGSKLSVWTAIVEVEELMGR